MTIEDTLEQLSRQQYPHQVDVVERVMAQVEKHPYLRPMHRRAVNWQRIGAVAAAAVVALVAVNVTLFHDNYDNEGMGSMIAQVNDYSTWNTVEESAVNPLEYIYEEE